MLAKTITKEYFDEQFDKLGLAIASGFTETNGNVKLLEEKIEKHLKLKTA